VFGVEFFDEAQEVAKIYKVNPKLDVTTSEILKNLGHDILHFSCHGYFDNKDPLSSGIVLKNDVLRAEKVFDSIKIIIPGCDPAFVWIIF
jgi:CHAT domain-containing protein